MSTERIHKLRVLAESHKATRGSAKIIIEILDELERMQNLYSIALDVAYGPWKKRGTALRKLKDLAGFDKK